MFETLFGAEMPLAMRFFIAFIVVLALIGAFFWVMRRFGAERLGSTGNRGRQPRLAVIDAAAVDGRRRLVLIRRDNVEHLLIIGGPTDVVVEANIVRAAQRDMPIPRTAAATDTLPRPVPLAEGSNWPLQPEPAVPPVRSARPVEEVQWTADQELAPPQPVEMPARRPEPVARVQRSQDSTLAGLGTEPMTRPGPSADMGSFRPSPMVERAPAVERPFAADRSTAAERPAERAASVERPPVPERTVERAPLAERSPFAERPTMAERASLAERASVSERGSMAERGPASERPAMERATPVAPPAAPPAPPSPTEPLPPTADQNLAEMAQRLEAALRRPMPAEPRPDNRTRPASEPAPATDAAPVPPAAEPRPKSKTLYDSLEQEMASLLGRPAGKP